MTAPSENDICSALATVCTRGLAPYWVSERASLLLSLACVRAKVGEAHGDDPGEDVLVAALGDVLRDQAKKLSKSTRIILTIVLALEPEYLGMSAGARRQLAGEQFRDGFDPVAGGTIRTHHEPQALQQLAALLHAEEQRHAMPALFETE